jgi:PAS domain S-box-containing protein
MVDLNRFHPRAGLTAAVSLVFVAAGCIVLVVLENRTARVIAAAALFAAAFGITVYLTRRARRIEAAQREEIERAEARYRTLMDGLPLVTWLTEPGDRGTTLYVSPSIDSLTGYSAAEWADESDLFTKLVHPEDRAEVLEALEETKNGTPLRTEYRLIARDGRVVWVQEETTIARDSGGEPIYAQTFLRNIDERKRAEDERESLLAAQRAAASGTVERQSRLDFLRQAGDQLSSTLDHEAAMQRVADLVVRDFADWCIVDVLGDGNELKRLAVARAEPGKLGAGPAVGDQPETAVRAVIEKGRSEVVPALGEGSSTNERPRFLEKVDASSVICVPLRARKQPLGALTVARTKPGASYGADDLALVEDLAARITIAADRGRLYREVEERADAARVLEHVADGILLLDRNGVVRLWNPAAEAITSVPAEDVVGLPAVKVIPGWQEASESAPVFESPDPGHAEVVVPVETKRGERWIAISGVQFFGGTVYAFRDLTDVRHLEEVKADFIATASHELRTPLAAVYGAAQTLLRHDFALDEVGRDRFVSLIADESERLGRIVNEILLANQLDAGRLDMEFEPFDAAEVVERVVESTRVYAPPTVSVDYSAADELPPVAADLDKVRQVLVNLVENAIKYSPDGGRVEVGVEPHDESVRFHVRDEGLGIPPEDQERVFEKFYRADPQMLRGVGGTGLGLYICKELVGRMGGHIWVESSGEKGSTFYFELPTAEVLAHGPQRQARLQSRN